MEIRGKGAPILGATLQDDGVQFGIYAEQDIGMVLKIYRGKNKECLNTYYLTKEKYCTGAIYHLLIEGIRAGDYYTWHTIGEKGEIGEALMDPYALGFEEIEKETNKYYSVIAERQIGEDTRPKIKWEDTIIYEMHVGGFTKGDREMEASSRGTFKGVLKKLKYLKSIGITSIELLPVYKWNKKSLKQKSPITGKIMEDVWGYNPISFFATQEEYTQEGTIDERNEQFRKFVREVHKEGMEVILDVVYNHTGEGGEGGSTFHFKALANDTYYKMKAGSYLNCTGTGNVLNTTHPIAKQLIIDSLRYWVLEMGVDGFRFDLASTLGQDEQGEWIQINLLDDIAKDPILRDVKLISESWDAKGNYNVGQMPYPFAEWSDKFRDTIRRFIKGDLGLTGDLAKCIEGKEVHFEDERKNPFSSIHFVTAHDGFTLWDLVSYNQKHNEANGEENRDGSNNNYSDNCGYEGESDCESINVLRQKRMRNYLTLLLISYGVPMLLMGDEIARTKKGNNNTYCQDNELLWIDWKEEHFHVDLRDFLRQLTIFRKDTKYLKNREKTVINWHGTKCYEPDWSYHSCSLAWEIMCEEEHIYFIINSYYEPLEFELPNIEKGWQKIIDTETNICQREVVKGCKYVVNPYTAILFIKDA